MADGYDPDLFAKLFEVEERHFWFTARNRALAAVIKHATQDLEPGYRLLEVGCGTGNTLRMLEDVCSSGTVFGMDLFLEGLRLARSRTAASLLQGRVEQPPFTTRFQVVGLFDVLEHINDDRAALEGIRRLVAPGGVFVLTVPAGRALWSRFDEESHHCRRYEVDDLHDKLVAAGFAVEHLTPFMATLYPLARLVRFASDRIRFRRRVAGHSEGSAILNEIKIRPGLNELLAMILRQEARLLGRGWTFPIGTSLLAVARPTV